MSTTSLSDYRAANDLPRSPETIIAHAIAAGRCIGSYATPQGEAIRPVAHPSGSVEAELVDRASEDMGLIYVVE